MPPRKRTLPKENKLEDVGRTLDMLINAARNNFKSFVSFLHPQGRSKYILSKLHVFLASMVDDMVSGKRGRFQCVSVSPQHGKSQILSVRAVAWILGSQPGVYVAITGFSHDLLVGFVADIQTIMESWQYKQAFPGVEPIFGFDRQDELRLTNGSSLVAKTVGRKLTGRPVDWLFIDDAHAGRAEAESKADREKIKRWFFADCLSRLTPDGKILVVGTRWFPSDLIGHITSPEFIRMMEDAGYGELNFEVTNLPAIAEHNPEAGEEDPIGREPGEALFPEVRHLKFLLGQKAMMPKYEWDSQYRGKPRASASGQVDVGKIKYVDMSEVPTDIQWLRGWDLALTEKQTSDFSAGALCAYDKRTELFYIIDMEVHKLMWTKMKSIVTNTALSDKAKYNAHVMAMEAVSGFDIGFRELQESLSGEVSVVKKNPGRGGKLMRAQPWLNILEAGRLRIVRASWNKDFVDMLDAFPAVEHDDMIDGVSIAREALMEKGKLLFA